MCTLCVCVLWKVGFPPAPLILLCQFQAEGVAESPRIRLLKGSMVFGSKHTSPLPQNILLPEYLGEGGTSTITEPLLPDGGALLC